GLVQRLTLFPYTTLFRSVLASTGTTRESDTAASARERCTPPPDAPGRTTPLGRPTARGCGNGQRRRHRRAHAVEPRIRVGVRPRSEEHTSELQSLRHLVC